MYSLLVASRQLYGDFLIELLAQLLYPIAGSHAQQSQHRQQQEEQMKIRFAVAETALGLAAWMSTLLGALLTWLVLSLLIILILVAALHRPLPPGIADRKKIQIAEFLMRISNEYFGNLVEWFFGPVVRNRLTRFLSALPFWLFGGRTAPKWCVIRTERIAGVKCRLYLPQGAAKRTQAALVYIHGGGWCMGRPRFYDGPLLHYVKHLGLTVVSIDYSLSPEVKFPTALLECERVLGELHREKFAELGVDKTRVALMGDSAGGNQCAVLCQRALKAGKVEIIKCQILVYPVIHLLDFQSPSYQFYYRSYPYTGLLNPKMLIRWLLFYMGIEPTAKNIHAVANNKHLSRQILDDKKLMALVNPANLPKGLPGQEMADEMKNGKFEHKEASTKGCCLKGIWRGNKIEPESEEKSRGRNEQELAARMESLLQNPDLCPLIANDLEGLCPALICTAGIDILRDEGIHYAQRLRQFGVAVEWKHYEAAYHGIMNMGKSRQRTQILADICEFLRKNLL